MTRILASVLLLGLCRAGARAEVLFPTPQGVWRVSASGSVEPVDAGSDSDGYSGELYLGSTLPQPSPEGDHIAYSKAGDLWLYGTKTGKRFQATRVGGPSGPGYASVSILLTGWSWDGRKFLYHVSHDLTEDPEGEAPDLKVKPRRYGFFIYDLAEKRSRPAKFPGHFLAWLPGGDFLLLSEDERTLLRWSPGPGIRTRLPASGGLYGSQVSLSPDGGRLLFVFHPSSGASRGSLVSQLDLTRLSMSTVTALGGWAEYQDPLFSPSGRSISYFRRIGKEEGFPKLSLAVDGQPVFEYLGHPPRYRWVDEESLVLALKDEAVVVLDARTGREKGRRRMR